MGALDWVVVVNEQVLPLNVTTVFPDDAGQE
jgi:hypothetical protein